MINIKRIKFVGFDPIRKNSEIIFDEKLTCIIGPKGSGKSSMIHLIDLYPFWFKRHLLSSYSQI